MRKKLMYLLLCTTASILCGACQKAIPVSHSIVPPTVLPQPSPTPDEQTILQPPQSSPASIQATSSATTSSVTDNPDDFEKAVEGYKLDDLSLN